MINPKFGRIGVLAGGPSSEKEISLKSGKAVYGALLRKECDTIFLDVWENIYDIIKNNRIDVAFITLHGRFGEDGTVQKILEGLGIPYTGSGPEASMLALDKIASKEIFKQNKIPTPRHTVLEKNSFALEDIHPFSLPIVIKPQLEGSSIGLSVVKELAALDGAINEAFQYGSKIILEEYIDGRELTVGILNDEPLPVIEIIPKREVYDYTAKYNDPETKYLVPARIDEELSRKAKELGLRSHMALGCRSYSRVDMMMDRSSNIFVLEVNTIPGMTERSLLPKAAQASGLDFDDLCIKLIENALQNRIENYETTK